MLVFILLGQVAAPGKDRQSRKKDVFSRKYIVSIMKRVGDWQLAHLKDFRYVKKSKKYVRIPNDGWIRAVFFTGVLALYRTTGDRKYLRATMNWAESNHWQTGPRKRFADDQCAGQVYAELYFIKKNPEMIAPLKKDFDTIVKNPERGPIVGWNRYRNWSWCDALFMAPPIWARLAAATHQQKYLNLLDTLWWDTTNYLFEKNEHLFYRDERFKTPKSPRAKKIFWSRGNGWVLAGLARVLQYMPEDYPDYPKFVHLFRKMAEKISGLQGTDGLWRSNLLEPDVYPQPETSGSALFCYALSWGINHNLLSRKQFLPVVKRAWRGLVGAVQENGQLGWVQPVGSSPDSVRKNDTMAYGSGAFLLAGSEVIKIGAFREN